MDDQREMMSHQMMSYQFKGQLNGLVCADCPEPLSDVFVRLYRHQLAQDVSLLIVCPTKDTFAILSDHEVRSKASSLIAESKTDAYGNFVFNLGPPQNYRGEAFEIDVYCATLPHRKPGHQLPPPVQFSLTSLRPLWRENISGQCAIWNHCLSSRYWCLLRARFGAWSICGRVMTGGETKVPLPALKVMAYDVDWTEHDELGSAWTDHNGKFRIDYLAEHFQKTPFSPVINLDLFGGPDIYFKITTAGGVDVLNESPARGRQGDRENQGNCFCVELDVPDMPPSVDTPIAFTHAGRYNIATQINTASGLTRRNQRAFHSTIRLHGSIPKVLNGEPVQYRFDIAEYHPVTHILGPASPVTQAQIARTVIGQRIVLTGDPLNPVKADDWTVNGDPGELVATLSKDGWIHVPQDPHFYPHTGSLPALLVLNSVAIGGWEPIDQSDNHAGHSTTPPPLARNRQFQIRMWVRSDGRPAHLAGTCHRIAIDNSSYDNVRKGGSWAPQRLSGQAGIAMLDVRELLGAGYNDISDALHVLYTAAHPHLGAISLAMTGPGGSYGFLMNDRHGSSQQNRYGTAIMNLPAPPYPIGHNVGDLPAGAYVMTLSVHLRLTTGDNDAEPVTDQIGFHKIKS